MAFSDEFIREVTDRNDIVDVVSAYTNLKRVGNRLTGLCPLHNEKTPSFSVSADRQLFHCFGCGAGGTVIQFVMLKENLDFVEAMKFLADRVRLPIPEDGPPVNKFKQAQIYDKKQTIYKINADAARYFHARLLADDSSQQYLIDRRITNHTATHFGLGFAPDEWDGLSVHLKEKGYTDLQISEAGLSGKRDNGTYYDRFRGRIIFPIIDVRGNIIGFGGRIMKNGDNTAKYLNSPETPVFNKGRNLFGLNFAKNSKQNQIIIAEGYMDVLSLHQNGVTNAVACLGTALTSDQARLLKKYAGEIVLCYDSDVAGKQATERAIAVLTEVGVKMKILSIVDGKDPDEYINDKGIEMFRGLLGKAETLVEYKIRVLKEQYNLDDVEQKIVFVEKMSEVFAKIENRVTREAYINKISRDVGISADAIHAEVRKILLKQRKSDTLREENDRKRITAQQNRMNGKQTPAQYKAEKILLNLICEKDMYRLVKNELSADTFSNDLHKRIAMEIINGYSQNDSISPISIINSFSTEEIGAVAEILHNDQNVEDRKKAIFENLNTLKDYALKDAAETIPKTDENINEMQSIIEQLKQTKKGTKPAEGGN